MCVGVYKVNIAHLSENFKRKVICYKSKMEGTLTLQEHI
jgi:hypothetical protein